MNCATGFRFMARAFPALLLVILPVASLAEKAPGFSWKAETQLRYDDNVYRTHDKFDKSDEIFVVKPEAAWVSLYGKHQFDLGYKGDYGRYFNKTDLDYSDHAFKAHALLDHSYRLRSEYTLGYKWDHDRPGGTDSFSFPDEGIDKWRNGHAKGKIYYGRDDGQGQVVGELRYHQRRYTNNNQNYRNYDRLGTTGTFYYRVAPKTRLLFELSYDDYDYQNDDRFNSDQSSKEYLYLTGVTWEATAKTTGIFKVGYQDVVYDNDRFGDQTGLYLWLDSIWKPNTYTKVTLGGAVENQASAQQATNGYQTKTVRSRVEHDITPRIRLIAKARYARDDYDDNYLRNNRNDDRWDLRLGMKYSLLRWLDIGAEYRYEERDSNVDVYDFDANVFMVSASTRFD